MEPSDLRFNNPVDGSRDGDGTSSDWFLAFFEDEVHRTNVVGSVIGRLGGAMEDKPKPRTDCIDLGCAPWILFRH